MKKSLFYLLFFVLSPVTFCMAQNTVVVGEIAPMEMFLIGIEKTNDTYTLTYKDQHSKDFNALRNFSFKESSFESLYSTLSKGFDTIPADIKMEFSGIMVVIHYEKQSEHVMVRFMEVDKAASVLGYSQFLTKSQIETIFGKKH